MSASHHQSVAHSAAGGKPLPTESRLPSKRAEAQKILIVEDERRLREMLMACMHEMGMTPTPSPTAEAALKLMDHSNFAVALIDLNLPGMSGMEFCEIVRQRWPSVEMIILTGFGDMNAARRAIRLDVVDFLTKPCGMDELEIAIGRAKQRWLDRWMGELHMPRSASPPVQAGARGATSVEAMERQLILAALERHHGNREAAADELGISVRKLYYRLRQYEQKESGANES
jgi:DNA-binding NtrC family response regulator